MWVVLRSASMVLPWVVLAVAWGRGGWTALGVSVAGLVMLADLWVLGWLAGGLVSARSAPSSVVLVGLVKLPLLGLAVYGLLVTFGALPVVVGTLAVLGGAGWGAISWARRAHPAAAGLTNVVRPSGGDSGGV